MHVRGCVCGCAFWRVFQGSRTDSATHPLSLLPPYTHTHTGRSVLHPSSPPLLTTLICFPLGLIGTRWNRTVFLANLAYSGPPITQTQNPQPPTLNPPHPHRRRLQSFMTPCGFCHPVVSGAQREMPNRISRYAERFSENEELTQAGASTLPLSSFLHIIHLLSFF